MWLKMISLLALGIILFEPCNADEGPLHVKNRFPLHLLFLTPRPGAGQLPGAGEALGSATVDFSAIYYQHNNGRWDFLIDMEMTTLEANVSYGLTPRLTLNLDLRMVYMAGGFMDGFLRGYHDALGVPNYGREDRPDNEFAYRISNGKEAWIDAEPGAWQTADSVVALNFKPPWSLLPGNPRQCMIAAVKLPIGKPYAGTGSGRFDYGLSYMVAWELTPWSIYAMPSIAFLSDPVTEGAEVKAENSYSLFLGLAYRYDEKWRWLVQLNGFTSPIQSTGIDALDQGAVELALGFQYRLTTRWSMEFAFCEDLTRTAPDFTVHLGLLRHFGW